MNSTTQNVDPSEIAKFSAQAHHWWDANGAFKPLHQLNPLRLQWVGQIQPIQNLHVLDVGCGGGILSESMAKAGAASVVGIDLAPASLQVAQLHALEVNVGNMQYRCISAEDMAEQHPAQFDVVTCMEMLEHVPNPASIVQACAKLVKPGGHVFFSSINRNLKSFLLAIVGAEYALNLLERGTHDYQKLIQPHELAAAARQAGLDLLQVKGMAYNPFTECFSLNADPSVNYLMATQRPTGDIAS
jgi:2-polyprenyl-6-hydroxyphenyl methylase / 3-demethylubiquinone-9 3-methyltransferase